MSKPKRGTLECSAGHRFEADVYRSANVTNEPSLKEQILSGQLNHARCPACGRDVDAAVPFLYHDMAAGQLVWVYPAALVDQAAAVREKVRRSHEIVGSVLPEQSPGSGRDVVFGIAELISWLNRASPAT